MRASVKNLVLGASGLALGAGFLWLALRHFDRQQFQHALATFDRRLVGAACALYWAGLALRVSRWQYLLRQLQPVGRWAVAEALIVGYAVNNLLPARLGEIFRADYTKHRLALSRSTLLGSIVIERLLDLAALLGCLGVGLGLAAPKVAGAHSIFQLIAINGVALTTLAAGVVWWLRTGRWALRWGKFARVVSDLTRGFAALNRRSVITALVLSGAIWACELGALWLVFAALKLTLAPAQVMLLLGAVSLSTLVPTAPGYLGTYQLVFALGMKAFGEAATVGLAASVLVQIYLFGSVTGVGLAIYLIRVVQVARAGARRSQSAHAQETVNG